MKRLLLLLAIIFTLFALVFSISDVGTGHFPLKKVAALFVNSAMEGYRSQVGHYPTTVEGLDALIHCPKGLEKRWKGSYLAPIEAVSGPSLTHTSELRLPLDPWGRPYQYRCPGIHNPEGYDLWSLGPIGVGGHDAIGNWKN